MPYRGASLPVAVLLAAATYVFWPGFLARLGEYGFAHHLHGVTAFAWMLLLIAQSILVDRREIAWHRRLGRVALVLIPLFTAANFMVVHELAASPRKFAQVFGAPLVFVDLVSAFAFAGFCWAALAHRRDPRLHGGFLLATSALLVMAVVTRIEVFFADDGPLGGRPFPEQFTLAFDLSMVLVLSFAAVLAWRHRRRARPFVALGGVTIVQWLGFHFAADAAVWRGAVDTIAAASSWIVGVLGLLVGAVAVWAGWRSSLRSARPGGRLPPLASAET